MSETENMMEALNEFMQDEQHRALLEFAFQKTDAERVISNQAPSFMVHLITLQLYGYESSALQTLYDIILKLNEVFISKKRARFLNLKVLKENFLEDLVSNQEEYDYFVASVKERNDDEYKIVNELTVNDYSKFLTVYNKIFEYLLNKSLPTRQQFYDIIRNDLGL